MCLRLTTESPSSQKHCYVMAHETERLGHQREKAEGGNRQEGQTEDWKAKADQVETVPLDPLADMRSSVG